MKRQIREILRTSGRLPVDVETLDDGADLHAAGLTSFGTVEVMMSLEETFGIEFPDRMMNRRNFATIAAIESAVRSLAGDVADAA